MFQHLSKTKDKGISQYHGENKYFIIIGVILFYPEHAYALSMFIKLKKVFAYL